MTTARSSEDTILELERGALERWGAGDPDGFLEISAPDVTYFDPYVEQRVDGIDALRTLYAGLRGRVHIDRFEIVNPVVQRHGELAVLSFQFVSYSGANAMRWNTTEVYRREAAGWRIIHTHWAFTRPGQ
jgi:ketosteroid isomerase-like protein